MKELKSIDRSFQNQKNEVIESDVPKSGFNMSYRNHLGGLVLGRLYPQSIQHLMPNDKISGSNEASITFEQLSTPVVDSIDVCVHNFIVTLRSIDNRWEKFMTPSKLNNMNANVSVPTFSFDGLIMSVLLIIANALSVDTSSSSTSAKFHFDLSSLITYFNGRWDFVYHSDSLLDLLDQIRSVTGPSGVFDFGYSLPDGNTKFQQVASLIFDFFIGKRSLLDYFGYIMVDASMLKEYFDAIFDSTYLNHYYNSPQKWLRNGDLFSSDDNFVWYRDQTTEEVKMRVYSLQNEYALRAYYAIWFEYYRNYDLEPRSLTLPEYHDFGATSIFGERQSPLGYYPFASLHYLIPRIRSWQQDAFTTAGIDDISRHVFAPLLAIEGSLAISNVNDDSLQGTPTLDNNTVMQELVWRNPATGSVSSVSVPIPSRLLSVFTPDDPSGLVSGSALELFSLRKAQMLENYLKRIYYGGDEYRDRMLHLYGARIEDYRINRPQWLSSSLDIVDPKQEVANTGVAPGSAIGWSAGSRLATATAVQSGNDGFTEFCPEFGVCISMLSIMPHATYDPMLLQNMQTKYTDFPIPQFANQMEDVISTVEIARRVPHSAFGYAPYGHAYRYRVDEVHGDYHDTMFDYVFLRFFDADSVPNLSWSFIHCRPKLPMFVNSVLLDGQAYGTFKHNFLVERPLPSPVETI